MAKIITARSLTCCLACNEQSYLLIMIPITISVVTQVVTKVYNYLFVDACSKIPEMCETQSRETQSQWTKLD